MRNLFRFFRCISSLQVTAEADVLGSCSEFIIDFLRKSLREEIFYAFFTVFYNQFFAHVSAGPNISCFFRGLHFWSCAQLTAGSNALGSFSAFCYKLCEQVTTGENVWRSFSVSYHWFCAKDAAKATAIFLTVYFILNWFCAQITARTVMISQATSSWSGMCGVQAFVWFFL